MAKQQPPANKQSKSKRDQRQMANREGDENGHDEHAASYEHELAAYLQQRIKPGLNRGAIPLLARSIAKEIAHQEYPNGRAEDEAGDQFDAGEELAAEPDDELDAETDDELSAGDDASADLETELHELQAELGEDWILYFSVHGDDTWLTAEKDDASQRVEAPTASVLAKAVKVLNAGGGRSVPS
jgi:hypothetical protein